MTHSRSESRAPRLLRHTVLWPDEATGPWQVTVMMALRDRPSTKRGEPGFVLVPVGLSMTSWQDGYTPDGAELPNHEQDLPTLTGVDLRDLRFGEIVSDAREGLAGYVTELASSVLQRSLVAGMAGTEDAATEARAVEFGRLSRALARQQHRNGRDLGDAHYRAVAATFLDAGPDVSSATDAVMWQFTPPTSEGEEAMRRARAAASQHIHRARKRGFLPAARRGRPSKAPTPRPTASR